MALTVRDKAILDFERLWWADLEAKAVAIPLDREVIHVLPPEAFQLDPLVVSRLRRQRSRRRPGFVEARPANDWPRR